MNGSKDHGGIALEPGATVAVIGGGPAGAFFALHLQRRAQELRRDVKVVVFERRRSANIAASPCPADCWKGCNYCAGGISPKLMDVLNELGLPLPAEVVQSRIRSITVQGYWKNIELEVPPGREIVTVYRGARPSRRAGREHNFDAFLLNAALKKGAELVGGEVREVRRAEGGKLRVHYLFEGAEQEREADFVVFAPGVNESMAQPELHPLMNSLQAVLPSFVPPRLRPSLIFELEDGAGRLASLAGTIHFVEYGSRELPLEMCSVVPKRGFITVTLVGPSVDKASRGEHRAIVQKFLELPHVRKLIPAEARLPMVCMCAPNMVVASAKNAFGDRVAAIGDMVTTRLYKDGILSAQRTARALADTILTRGVDVRSLDAGYGPTLKRFKRDNRYAAIVFLLHRFFFSSSIPSRVLYQAVITERKTVASSRRHLEAILWRIASGDDRYVNVFRSMIHPATIWLVLTGGAAITFRNYLTELLFGLHWEGFGRFTTGVALEKAEAKHLEFARLIAQTHTPLPEHREFERMYTINIKASRERILQQLGRFGEADRGYFRPRWVRIHRVAGEPNVPGCVVRYDFMRGRFCFNLLLEQIVEGHSAIYRVQDGFARGGVLIFEIEPLGEDRCALSIYVAFKFTRGRNLFARAFWWGFRLLFPAFAHDVIWNHSLCQLKNIVELEAELDRSLQERMRAARREPATTGWEKLRDIIHGT